MRPATTVSIESHVRRTFCLVAACGLLGFWFAPTRSDDAETGRFAASTNVAASKVAEQPTKLPSVESHLSESHLSESQSSQSQSPQPQPSEMSLQVQRMLAEGGCPGWISLAGEPEVLQALPPVENADYQASEANATSVVLAQDASPADESLLSGEDDLLGDRDDLLGAPAIRPPTAPSAVPPEQRSSVENAPNDALADDALVEEDLLGERDDLLTAPREELPPSVSESESPAEDSLLNDRDDLLGAPRPAPSQPTPNRPAPAEPALNNPSPSVGNSSLFAAPPADVPNPHGAKSRGDGKKSPQTQLERCEFVADSLYPNAESCRTCHEKIYDEWSVSSHAYAAVSPMFQKFEQTIYDLTHGTIGYFCYRCHSPVGVSLGYQRTTPLWEMPQAAREGVTCVACHRVNEMYSKTNGERRIVPGDIYSPVYGSIGGSGVAEVITQKEKYKVKTSPADTAPGQPIHQAGLCFPQLSRSEFCTSCHQVAVYPGIKLEVVWEQYRASPACKKGVSCQDCHMGRIPGVASGYEFGPAAIVNKKPVQPNRKHANHSFYGPGFSIAHPGIFPWNPKAKRWTMPEWLLFDWRAGWGTQAFEDAVEDGQIAVSFPKVWNDVDDRMDARDIISDNQKKLKGKDAIRKAVLENGSHIDGPFFKHPPRLGQDMRFSYQIMNTNDGHNLPTASLGAQPQMWANVVLIGPRGNRLWETGYLDRLGDLANIHSLDVRNKQIPFDWQLFNMQTIFLITGVKGTDREFPLPINVSIDQLPFARPGAQPIRVINHPPFIRMETNSLPALGSRRIPYRIPKDLLREPGRYRLTFRMRSRTEPMYFMRFCSATPGMQQAMLEGTMDFHQSSYEFEVK